MNNILEVSGLTKTYNTFKLEDITFALPKGYIMGLIGANGAGKTTTLKSMLGMLNFESGKIKLLGEDFTNFTVKDDIGVVMDLTFYNNDWTLTQLEKAISVFYTNWDTAYYHSLLNRFKLEEKKKIKELSRGMKVKLMLATALAHHPKLLLLDEPTSGLDPAARQEIVSIIQEFIQDENKGVLYSTHITTDLDKAADYITFLRNGKVAYTGTKDMLLEEYLVVKGGLDQLTSQLTEKLIGTNKHSTGFDGLMKTEDLPLADQLLIESASLEDIMVYTGREDNQNE